MAKGIVTVRVLGDARGLTKELEGATGRMKRFGDRMSATVTPALALLGASSVKAASDLQEAGNAAEGVFGARQSQRIDEWASNAAGALGQSARQATEAAASFGNMLNTVGLAADESANMSMNLVQLATDMGSLNNQDPSAMLTRIQSAMAGEAEPLRRFGVLLSAAAVESKALELGLADSTAALTEADKVQARYAIILEQTTTAQGDFGRTSDALANQQRIMAASFEDTRAEIGERLLPVMSSMAGVAIDVLDAFSDLDGGAQNVIIGLGGVAAAAGPVLSIGGRMVRNWDSISEAASKAHGAMSLASTVKFTVLAAGVAYLVDNFIDARREAAALKDEIVDSAGDDPVAQLAALNAELERINRTRTIGQRIRHGFLSLDVISDERAAVNELTEAIDDVRPAAERAALSASYFGEENGGLILTVRELTGQLGGNVNALDAARAATDGTVESTDDLAEATDEAAREVTTLTERLRILSGVHLDVDRAMINYRGSLDGVIGGLAEGSRSLDVHTEAGRTNRQALIDLIEESFNLVGAMEAEGRTAAEIEPMLQSHVRDLESVMEQAGFTTEQITGLIDEYNLTPDEIHTAVFASGIQSTVEDLARVRRAMGEVGDSIEEVSARLNLRVAGIATPANYSPGQGDGPGFSGGPSINIHGSHGQGDGPGLDFGVEFLSHVSDIIIKEMPALGMLSNGVGYQAMMTALRGVFPGLPLISGLRPGAITATGNPSYHGAGRAVDIPPDMRVFNAIAASPVAAITKELIFSPAGGRQIWNGRNHVFGEPTRGDHWDHIHWALANGGIVRSTPGGTAAILGEGGSDEAVIPLDRPLAVHVTGWSATLPTSHTGQLHPWPDGTMRPHPPTNAEVALGDHLQPPSGQRPISELPDLDAMAALQKEIARNQEALRIEGLSAGERLAEVREEMAGVVEYSDEWVRLLREADRLAEAVKAARTAPLIAERDKAQQMLDGLIRDRASASEQLLRLEQSYADDVARIQQDLADRTQGILDARMESLVAFTYDAGGGASGVDLPFLLGFGAVDVGGAASGASGLLAQLRGSNRDLADMGAMLDGLREDGLNDDVVRLLGLDSPQQMDLLREVSGMTLAEIDELNRLVVDRHRLAGDQVAAEQAGLLGTMGGALADLQAESAVAMAGVTGAFEGASDALRVQIVAMSEMISGLMRQIMELNEAIASPQRVDLPGGGFNPGTDGWGTYATINVVAPNPRSAAQETANELRSMELMRGLVRG